MIVALMTDPTTGKPVGVHRTFIAEDATKLSRKMIGKQEVIQLSPDDTVTTGLGLTEGIEDGLAVLLSGWAPVWAAGSAGGVRRFPVLDGIECLTIFADADMPGLSAAEECAERWIDAGKEVVIQPPPRVEFGHG